MSYYRATTDSEEEARLAKMQAEALQSQNS